MSKSFKQNGKKFGKRLGMQTLEEKAMMAGDVAVSVSGGDLIINEAADSIGGDQQVQVSQLENGKLRVQGLNGTQIETQAIIYNRELGRRERITIHVDSLDYNVSGGIDVDLGEGRDNFTTSAGGPTLSTQFMDIDMGDGNDRDFVALRNAAVDEQVNITTGGGNDSVSLHTVQVGEGGDNDGDLTIETGNGQDLVSMYKVGVSDDVVIDMALSQSLAERDTLMMNQVAIHDDLEVDFGGGNDKFDFFYSSVDEADIEAGAGDDDVVAIGSVADDFNYDGGTGTDEFWAFYSNGVDTNDIDLDLSSAVRRTYGQV
ncbi:hypothetical protein Pla123a_14640 [Posidoniimonas polymericola]|uniref:Uncharacterized protein n=1 Tax=Posidoniimonas polymericola TaxID=2528002 RepID=A0A5C5YS16_9BACT|nr:hypothetical protein [Posidoniimonas polymericola]TWT77668.1 hypothetical protein Pla123a_14640 [Posidoniimonas polymericola]